MTRCPPDDPSPFADLSDDVPPEEFAGPPGVPPEDEPRLSSDIDSRKLTLTFIPDETGAKMRRADMTLPQLAEHIRLTSAPGKMALPWLKLALFGNKRSEKRSLRTNENVLQITGIEVEHDEGEISFDTAHATILRARVRCILYTSPSHVPGTKERWRILLPLSRNGAPKVREKFAARANGLFGGKLALESFVLSQAYLYGSVSNNPNHRVEVVDGDFIDLRDDLYAGSIFKDGGRVGGNGASPDFSGAGPQRRSRANDDPEPVDRDKIEAALNVIDSNCSYEVWLKVAAALHSELGEHGFPLFDRWSAKATGKAEDGTPRYTSAKAKERWRGARTMRNVAAATIFYYANQADPAWRQCYDAEEARRVFARMAGAPGGSQKSGQAATPADSGVALEDFYAYMPTHSYIFVPTRDPWPASSVNTRLSPVPALNKDGTPSLDKNGKPRRVKPSDWLDRYRPVEQMTWAPGEPLVVPNKLMAEGGWFERQGTTTFNLYRPPVVRQGNSANADRWVDLVQRIYPDDADHIIAYCAHRIQRPAEKINHGILLGGSTGIGKDSILEPLKLGVGPWNFKEVSPQDIMGNYNDFMQCVVLRISEAHDLGDINRFAFYDHMKTILATPPDVVRVNGKYMPQHYVLNVAGVIFTTNNRFDSAYLPPNDRRTYVAWSDLLSTDFVETFWTAFWDWYKSGGLENVVAYLEEYDLSKFDPKAPPKKTEAFWQIVGAGAAPENSELADILDALGAEEKSRDAEGKPLGPIVTTLGKVTGKAEGDLFEWLKDRKNRRVLPHRFEACGYAAVRNPDAKDGLWVIGGRRQVVYGRKDVPPGEQFRAARKLTT
jgi:hypothetical protein